MKTAKSPLQRVLLAVTVLFALLACQEKEITTVPAKIVLDNADGFGAVAVKFSNKVETQSISFTADGDWRIHVPSDATWITVSPSSGHGNGEKVTAQITVQANLVEKKRGATLSFISDGLEQKALVMLEQEQLYIRKMQLPGSKVLIGQAASTYTVKVTSVFVDSFTASSTASWLTAKMGANSGELKLTVTANNGAPRSCDIVLTSAPIPGEESIKANLKVTQFNVAAPKPDILDVDFKSDGSAIDVAAGRTVTYYPGDECVVSLNKTWNTYVPSFSHSMGGAYTAGCYKVEEDAEMISLMEDGYSMEAVFMLSEEPNGKEIKAFSCTRSGGTALMVGNSSHNNNLTFIINNGGWKFCDSGIVPVPGTYYHVLGTWDKASGDLICYIDGEKKAVVTGITGAFKRATMTPNYFTIGGNQANDGGWRGDVVEACLYSTVISADEAYARAIETGPNHMLFTE